MEMKKKYALAPQIVKEPMDLKTMSHKVHAGQYKTLQEMRDDCELMSKNALLFNRAPGEVRVSLVAGCCWHREDTRRDCLWLLLFCGAGRIYCVRFLEDLSVVAFLVACFYIFLV